MADLARVIGEPQVAMDLARQEAMIPKTMVTTWAAGVLLILVVAMDAVEVGIREAVEETMAAMMVMITSGEQGDGVEADVREAMRTRTQTRNAGRDSSR